MSLAGSILLLLTACKSRVAVEGPTVGPGPWKGVGWHPHTDSECSDLKLLRTSWYHNWLLEPSCGEDGFVPMVWSDAMLEERLPRSLTRSGYDALLAFNEPDVRSQADMTVEEALALWPKLEATGLRLSSPAPSLQGERWLEEFLERAQALGYRVDFLALHWYGRCPDPQHFDAFLDRWATHGLPIWITEWACWKADEATNQQFLEGALDVLAEHPEVERIAWFANRTDDGPYRSTALVDHDGTLTTLGEIYRDAPPIRP